MMKMLVVTASLIFAGTLAPASECPVDVIVQPVGADLVSISIKNISKRDVFIPHDFLPWSMFGFGVTFVAKYQSLDQPIQAIFGTGHRPENILLKSNASLNREISLSKRFPQLSQDLGPVQVAWRYSFAEAMPKENYQCLEFGGSFVIVNSGDK